MKLPNADRAFIDTEKLRNYCLSLDHPRGKNKARMFLSLLALSGDQAELLRVAILQAVRVYDAKLGNADNFGQRFTVDFEMEGPTRRVTVRSAWIVLSGEGFPRLTSCYIL